jgi:ribosomal protein S18 acetylase RimI-like enzyme
VYFIRKDFKDKVITIPETAYNFKIFYQYPKNLNEFALSRSRENSNIFFDVYSKIIAKRLSEGMAACVLLQGEKIVSVFFTSTQNCTVEQVNYIYQPKKSELVITDIYTLIDYRRKGLYSLLLQHAINHYRKIGINVFVMWVMKHNRATIQAQLKLGFTEVFQTVNLFSWLGFEKVSVNISTNSLENL